MTKHLLSAGCSILFRFIAVVIVIALVMAAKIFSSLGKEKDQAIHTVKVEKGTIVEKALAVGTIEPVSQISVKSKISGVVKKLFVDVGESVQKGDPLLKVQPEPTPLELAEAKRQVDLAKIQRNNLKLELARQKNLQKEGMISLKDLQSAQAAFEQADIRYKIASEKLALLVQGKIKIAKKLIETIIRAPISGSVLERTIELGDPVVPLTSYQEGTVLMRIADMSKLIFKGTVDEIDVGKLKAGMRAEIQLGALPKAKITGNVTKIALRAQKRENATVFPIEIALDQNQKNTLRAGYSANASIIIQERKDVPTIPERVITFRDGKAFVRVKGKNKQNGRRCRPAGAGNSRNSEHQPGIIKMECHLAERNECHWNACQRRQPGLFKNPKHYSSAGRSFRQFPGYEK